MKGCVNKNATFFVILICKLSSAGIIKSMRTSKSFTKKAIYGLVFLVLVLPACSAGNIEETPPAEIPTTVTPLGITPTIPEPTATLEPQAALVNGKGIPLDWFEKEVERYLFAQEDTENSDLNVSEARLLVLNDLIDQVLFAQAAVERGINFSDDEVQNRFDVLAQDADINTWMLEWGYTKEELLASLRLQMLVASQRDYITDSIPESMEQVELRQVLALTEPGADRALTSLKSGTPFEKVASEFSPDTGGYLGWTPPGYLLIPTVEKAAFNQEVGTYTEIIKSEIGYHIVLVIAREERPLTTDARLVLERQALNKWVEEKRAESTIVILIN